MFDEATMKWHSRFWSLPPVLLTWSPSNESETRTNQMSVPVYTDTARQKLIAYFQLPCTESEMGKWLLYGVAVFV